MPGAIKTPIEIRFDGLFLHAYDSQKKRFEAKINTAAKDHRLKIVLSKYTYGKDGGKLKCRRSKPLIFKREQIKSLQPIIIFIGEGDEPKPSRNSAKVNQGNYKILDLEDKQFYNRKLNFNRKKYGATVHLFNGVIEGSENINDAYRVKKKLFGHLDFPSIRLKEWNDFVKRHQVQDPKSIIELAPFTGDAIAKVEIKRNQKLWVLIGKKSKPLFEPLEPLAPGESYKLMIEYLDETKPLHYAECIGFAYHCRALELNKGEPIYCIFRPKIKRGKGNLTMTSTITGICIGAQIGSESD